MIIVGVMLAPSVDQRGHVDVKRSPDDVPAVSYQARRTKMPTDARTEECAKPVRLRGSVPQA